MVTVESTLTRVGYSKITFLVTIRWWPIYFIIVLLMILVALISGIMGVLLFVLIFCVLCPLLISVAMLFLTRSSQNRIFFTPQRYVFNDDGVSTSSSVDQHTVKWAAFVKWRKMAGYYVLFLSTLSFYAIRQSAIPVELVPKFESLLDSKITKR